MAEYNVIGLMSGTSLDGLDIAYCTFKQVNQKWHYTIHTAETIKYSRDWQLALKKAHLLSAEKLLQLHSKYGEFLGEKVISFIQKHKLKSIDFVSSHGHTIFHRPENGFTFQLGNGASVAATCRLKVICDYRITDVALKGQGAPLVPIGDKLLFEEYDFCLNLGGFSNISFDYRGDRIAFDICPVNMALNYLAAVKGKSFDKGGIMAKTGSVDKLLLKELNNLSYYKRKKAKSLGREWFEQYFSTILDSYSIPIKDKLATVTEHIAEQICRAILNPDKGGEVLITGGGANNTFLIKKIKEKLPACEIIVPAQNIVNFKEALVFAFLGVLKTEGKINTLRSVTGATQNSSGGVVFSIV